MSKLFWRKSLIRGAIAALTGIMIVGSVGLSTPQLSVTLSPGNQLQHDISWNVSNPALATSGGRSSGGSFGSSSGGSSSGGSSSGGSSSGSSSSGGYSSGSSSRDSSSSSYTSNSGSSSGSNVAGLIVLCGFIPAIILIFYVGNAIEDTYIKMFLPKEYAQRQRRKANIKQYREAAIDRELARAYVQEEEHNDTVTVTQIQVALLASAREVQERFNEIATEYDWSTPEGLDMALKETVLALLRSPEAWTHVSTKAKTLTTRERAKQYFDSLSMEERSKFEMESLVNVGGTIKKRAIVTKEEGPADYIVATLIVGTAHDQLLFETIHSADELRGVLKQLGAIAPNYLMVYEMLWSPQDSSDSLTYEELLLNYPHMLQIC